MPAGRPVEYSYPAILALADEGLTPSEIAARFSMKADTVRWILRKRGYKRAPSSPWKNANISSDSP
jgi:hypothetical protein